MQPSNPSETMALDASVLFKIQRERWRRDPAQLKMDWFFSFSAPSILNEATLDALLSSALRQFSQRLPKAKVNPEVHFDEEDSSTWVVLKTNCTINEVTLNQLHQSFAAAAAAHRVEYTGAACRLHEEATNADEMFGQLTNDLELDPTTLPLDWVFAFHSKHAFNQDGAQRVIDSFGQLLSATSDTLSAEGGTAEDGSTILQVTYSGTMTKEMLVQLHVLGTKSAKAERLTYLGASVDPPDRELSTEEGVQWIDPILAQTSRWKLEAIEQVAGPIRKKHLSELHQAKMKAANWMPTMSIRFPKPTLRSKEEIVKRLMGAFTAVAFVCAPDDAIPTALIHKYIKSNQLKKSAFSSREALWLQSKRQDVRQFAPQAGWITENIWSLAWILGYKPTPNPSAMQVSELLVPIRNGMLKNFERSFDELMTFTKLRSIEQILTLEDLLYCAHNAYRNDRKVEAIGLVQERRQPLTWALSPETPWDETDVST